MAKKSSNDFLQSLLDPTPDPIPTPEKIFTEEAVDADSEMTLEQMADYRNFLSEYKGDHLKAIFKFCFKYNLPYHMGVMVKVVNEFKDTLNTVMPRAYFDAVKKDKFAKEPDFFSQLHQKNFEKVYSQDHLESDLDEESKKNRLQCIDILAFDPFADDDPEDRPQLYRDMCGLLTESMRKDIAKAKAALSVVRGYSNLSKYQAKINQLLQSGSADEGTQKTLDQLIKIQKTMQDSINATSIANSFVVKGIGNSGHGMLSDVMNQVEMYGVDEGVTNFYDIETSKAIEEVANISFKAQLNQVNLSRTDYADIIATQSAIVKKAQRQAKDAMEALRIAKSMITKQSLLQELEAQYRQKGISEKDIEDFIAMECDMVDSI